MWDLLADNIIIVALWSLLATAAMTTIISGSQGLGLSRLSLHFMVGTAFTAKRNHANILGFFVYLLGGGLFAVLYVMLFFGLNAGSWWIGLLLGLAHGGVLLVPYMHPLIASEYYGPTRRQRLEPPGFVGLNYGYRTPLSVMIAQGVYGLVLGLCYQMSGIGPV